MIDRISRCLCLLLLAVSINAQSQDPGKQKYEALLEKVKAGDTSVNFRDLRMAYTESQGYSPYGGDSEAGKSMFSALKDKDYDKALGYADTILKQKYVDIFAHLVSSLAYTELNNAERAKYHQSIVQGLTQSILKWGRQEHRNRIRSDSHRRRICSFSVLGLRRVSQSLVKDKDHNYDRMDAVDRKTKQTSTYYFNIDIPFNWLSKSLKK